MNSRESLLRTLRLVPRLLLSGQFCLLRQSLQAVVVDRRLSVYTLVSRALLGTRRALASRKELGYFAPSSRRSLSMSLYRRLLLHLSLF